MDKISNEVLDAMHILAARLIGEKVENGNTAISVDYNTEQIIFEDFTHSSTYRVNCGWDSERGSISDFTKLLTKLSGHL
ncbi:MAG: hypothetical protein MJZ37_00180 [Bacilli bacterium]|nr:hypothetical protein [Bacilli bacterium]